MPKREVDRRKTSKALRKLRKVVERTSGEEGPKLTAWEQEFVSGVSERLETYGSAFRDLTKGRAEEALSVRQSEVARVIERKSRPRNAKIEKSGKIEKPGSKPEDLSRETEGLRRSTFKRKTPPGKGPRVRDINDDPDLSPSTPQTAAKPARTRRKSAFTPALRDTPAPETPAPENTAPDAPVPPARRPSLRLIRGGKAQD